MSAGTPARSAVNRSTAVFTDLWSPRPLYASISAGYTAHCFGCRARTVSPHFFAATKSCRASASSASPTQAAVLPFSPGWTFSERFSACSARP